MISFTVKLRLTRTAVADALQLPVLLTSGAPAGLCIIEYCGKEVYGRFYILEDQIGKRNLYYQFFPREDNVELIVLSRISSSTVSGASELNRFVN